MPLQTDYIKGETLLIDKPIRWTSFDVVNKIRIALRQSLDIKKIKVGHAGTLDPLATGLVIVCTGRATKNIEKFMADDKEYIATLRLGQTTPSFDLETPIDATYPTDHITRQLIEQTLTTQFTGEQEQIPPIFSAIRVNGKRAYELARKGKTDDDVKMQSRHINITDISIRSFNMPDLTLRIRCSKGTYIRALARDIGVALHSGAHLTNLRRTAIGQHSIDQATNIDDLINHIKQQGANINQ